MRKVIAAIVALTLVVVVTGCATLPMESKLEKPVSMTKTPDKQGKDFTVTTRVFWLIGGLAPLIVPELDQLIGPEVADHAGVQNLKITTQYDFIDVLINAFTGGIIYARTVTIEGQVYD